MMSLVVSRGVELHLELRHAIPRRVERSELGTAEVDLRKQRRRGAAAIEEREVRAVRAPIRVAARAVRGARLGRREPRADRARLGRRVHEALEVARPLAEQRGRVAVTRRRQV